MTIRSLLLAAFAAALATGLGACQNLDMTNPSGGYPAQSDAPAAPGPYKYSPR